MASYVAAIDQGTSSTRVILYEQCDGPGLLKPVGSHQELIEYSTPKPGWAQMSCTDIFNSVLACADGVMAKVGAAASQIKGIGITNQRESLCVWDRTTGEPLYDCILWLDTRTRETAAKLESEISGGADGLRGICGLPVSTYFTGVKLRWLIDNEPEVKAKMEKGEALIGTIDAWVIWKLTGGAAHVTDVTNASRTMMMDLKTSQWHDGCIDSLGVGVAKSALPKIVSSAQNVGSVSAEVCASFAGVPVTGCIGDQQSAMVGQRCFEPGQAKTTYGTGAFTLINTGTEPSPSEKGLLTTTLFQMGEAGQTYYALEGSVGSCAIGINWFVDNLKMLDSAPHINELAAKVPPGAEGVYFVPAFGGILAPRWRDDARGTLVGLTLRHSREHVARSVLEGIAFQIKDVVDAMVQDSGVALTAMRVDGGVSQSEILLQAQADLLNVTVQRPEDIETTALGAAYCTAIGAGLLKLSDFKGQGDVEKEFTPVMDEQTRASLLEGWERAVNSSLGNKL